LVQRPFADPQAAARKLIERFFVHSAARLWRESNVTIVPLCGTCFWTPIADSKSPHSRRAGAGNLIPKPFFPDGRCANAAAFARVRDKANKLSQCARFPADAEARVCARRGP
jgi:hypothetical protein